MANASILGENMKRIIALFLLIFTACSCYAQTPMELLEKYVPNISIPDKNIETFHFQLSITNEGDVYTVQNWYKNNGHFGFNLFDKDKTPVLVIRDDKALFYDAMSKQIWLATGNINIVKIIYENAQLVANVFYHRPNEQEKENAINVSFLDLAKPADDNMAATEKDGLLEITGYTSQKSKETTVIDTKSAFPFKSLTIGMDDSTVVFDDIKINSEIADDASCFTYPAEALNKNGVKLSEIDPDSFIAAMQMSQVLIQSCLVRAALYNPENRESLETSFNTKYDWADLKAADMINSAKLRQIFKLGE